MGHKNSQRTQYKGLIMHMKKLYNYDAYTFGDTPACVYLSKILNERQISSRKVQKILSSANIDFKELEKVSNKQTIAKLVLDYYIDKTDKSKFEPLIKNLCKNILTYKYRQLLYTSSIKGQLDKLFDSIDIEKSFKNWAMWEFEYKPMFPIIRFPIDTSNNSQ